MRERISAIEASTVGAAEVLPVTETGWTLVPAMTGADNADSSYQTPAPPTPLESWADASSLPDFDAEERPSA